MEAQAAHPSQHYVTVSAGEPNADGTFPAPVITFECRDPEAKCHTYPACDCDHWTEGHAEKYGEGHQLEHHDRCWLEDWFDVDAASYTGRDATDEFDHGFPRGVNRSGPITVEWAHDYPEWNFVQEASDV